MGRGGAGAVLGLRTTRRSCRWQRFTKLPRLYLAEGLVQCPLSRERFLVPEDIFEKIAANLSIGFAYALHNIAMANFFQNIRAALALPNLHSALSAHRTAIA